MDRITMISQKGIEILKHFEDIRLQAYRCPAGVWTIGYGATRYPDGTRVKQGEGLAAEGAEKLLLATVKPFCKTVDDYTRDDIKQHEFDALVCLCYNIGPANFKTASLLHLVNGRRKDPEQILQKFMLWRKARIDGKLRILPGLERRRRSEAWLYVTGEVKFFQT